MWATLQIGFYLTRDTLHRWRTRVSSPLARLSVVFFLSVCGLVFLSSYVISVKILRQRIHRSGGNLVVATEMVHDPAKRKAGRSVIPPAPEKYNLYLFNEAFATASVGTQHYSLIEYLPGCTVLFPATARCSTFLLPAIPCNYMVPETLKLEGYSLHAVTLPEQKAGLLRRLFQSGAVFIPYGSLNTVWEHGFIRRYVMQIKDFSAAAVQRQENILLQLSKLDKRNLHIISSGKLLEELGDLEKTQYKFRVWVTVGISVIICLLLTCVSSLEFRQNSHIYALMGSFGVNRAVLFLCFLLENTVLVAAGFAAALATIFCVSDYITSVLYKSPDITLNLWELENDIRTFLLAFSICIAVSSLPVGIAASRPIGKVLK